MVEITALLVKDLRNKTGAGMADCKKALEETNGNIEEAIDYLRKKGAASAAKRADRSSNEGFCATRISEDGQTAVLVGVTSETDFVSRNEEFIQFANQVAEALMNGNAETIEQLNTLQYQGQSIEQLYNGILAKFSERIEIAKFQRFTTNGSLITYVHGGSKLAVVLELSNRLENENQINLAKDIAMQIAAMSPQFVDRSHVTQATLDKEKEIYTEQAIAEGKNPEIAAKIALGRVDKFFKEFCLVEQVFVKDGSKTIADVLKEISPDAKINQFVRYSIGEA